MPDLLKYLEKNNIKVTQTVDTSLTSNVDRVNDDAKNRKQVRSAQKVSMTEQELDTAVEKMVREWPAVEKRWTDPPIHGQNFCALSFMPSSQAKPDSDGIYGYVKVRGVFENEEEYDIHCEKILNEYDSYHAINMGRVGHPLPLVKDDDDRFVMEVNNVSLKQKIREEMSKNVRDHREKQKDFVKEAEAKAQEQKEKDEAALRGEVDEEERYITLRVKRANLIFTLYQMLVSMKRYKDTLHQTISILDEMDQKFPEYQQTFLAKYNYASEQAGVPTEKNHIIKYMVGDVPFSLESIPDHIEVDNVKTPLILPIDINSLNYQDIAEKMSKESTKESTSAKESVSQTEPQV